MMIGKRISDLRESRSVLQKDLAKAIHIDPVVLNRIEKGKRSSRGEELRGIADYFNVSVDYLLGRATPKAPSLSDEQTTLLSGFELLDGDGRQLILSMLDSLKVSHAKKRTAPTQKTSRPAAQSAMPT